MLWTFVFVFTSLVTLGVADPAEWALYPFAVSPVGTSAAALPATRRRRGDVADLVVELDKVRAGDVRERLGQVLGDPSVVVALWSAEREAWLDGSGHAVSIPVDGSHGVSYVGSSGGVMIHDRDLLDQPRLVGAAGPAALLALGNDPLGGRLRGQMAEVRESRMRLVEGDDRERRRLQHTLRDTVQVRLGELQPHWRALRPAGRDRRAAARQGARRANRRARRARRAGAGIHPSVLDEVGLADTHCEALAARTPVPVDVRSWPAGFPTTGRGGRLLPHRRSAARTSQHSGATRASVEVQSDQGLAQIE